MQTTQSVNNLVSSQAPQALGVCGPGGGRVGGNAPIVVQIYAIGRGVTLVGQGSDLGRRQGAFEIEAYGKIFVFDPLGADHAYGFVAPVQGDVATVFQALQAVDQEYLAKFGCVVGHGGSTLKTAILTLPQGYGKTSIAHQFASRLGCTSVVEEWSPSQPLTPGALHLTNAPVLVGGTTSPQQPPLTMREQRLINALQAVVVETMAYPPYRPYDSESNLPYQLVENAQKALDGYGLRVAPSARCAA